MRLAGEFTIDRPSQHVFSKLVDPRFISNHLPDVESFEIRDQDHFQVRARMGVGFLKGMLDFSFLFREKVHPSKAVLSGEGSGMGSRVDLTVSFQLASQDNATRVTWNTEADVSGRLASIAGAVLEPVMKQNADRLIQSLRNGVEREP